MGRPGEIRFLNYTDWQFHHALCILNIWWSEMKRLRKSAMPMIPDYSSFLFDIYFVLGCYYCVSGGLMRSESQKQSGQENIVFPLLFAMQVKSVATKLAYVLRAIFTKVVGDRCPPHILRMLQAKFTGKSLCQSSISGAAYGGRLSLLQVCARSGHQCNNSTDSYLDTDSVLNGLEGKNDVVLNHFV